MLDYAMGGRPEDRHVFNRTALVLHMMNTALVIVLLYALFGEAWVAAITGLLFGVHPLTVEPIVWLGERKAILAGTFSFWALVLYVAYVRRGHRGFYLGSILAYVLALLSKPSATPLPVLMLLLDYWPLGRMSRRAVVEKVPFLVIGVMSGILTLLSHASTSVVSLSYATDAKSKVLLACAKLMFYLGKLIWPANLSPHYSTPAPPLLTNPVVVSGVVGVLLLIAVTVLSVRWTRAVLVGASFYFLAMLPMLGFVEYSPTFANDNYAYLPMVGLFLPVAWGVGRLMARPSGGAGRSVRGDAIFVAMWVVAGLEMAVTRHYLSFWKDTESLFRRVCALAPDMYVGHNDLGVALTQKGRHDEAVEHFNTALRLKPDYAEAHHNLGVDFATRGHIDQAIVHYREALRIKPHRAETHNNLGLALAVQGKTDEAIAHYKESLRLKPNVAEAHNNLANALVGQGKIDEAVAHYKESLRLKPNIPQTHNNLAMSLAAQGKINEAIAHYREALRIKPDYAKARTNLANLLAAQGKVAPVTTSR